MAQITWEEFGRFEERVRDASNEPAGAGYLEDRALAGINRHTFWHVQLRLLMAIDFFDAIEDLERVEAERGTGRAFPAAPLARSAMEAAEIAHWVMAAPSSKERRRRSAQAEYASLVEKKTALCSFGDDRFKAAEKECEEYRETYKKAFGSFPGWSLNVGRKFGEEATCHCYHGTLSIRGGEVSGDALWRYFSGVTHSHMWVADMFTTRGSSPYQRSFKVDRNALVAARDRTSLTLACAIAKFEEYATGTATRSVHNCRG